jgi:hypothetical protein
MCVFLETFTLHSRLGNQTLHIHTYIPIISIASLRHFVHNDAVHLKLQYYLCKSVGIVYICRYVVARDRMCRGVE